jgi:hypothetical protein
VLSSLTHGARCTHAGITDSQGRADFSRRAAPRLLAAAIRERIAVPTCVGTPHDKLTRPGRCAHSDDVEQYFNYMGCHAVEGTYDRTQAMLDGAIARHGRRRTPAWRAPT